MNIGASALSAAGSPSATRREAPFAGAVAGPSGMGRQIVAQAGALDRRAKPVARPARRRDSTQNVAPTAKR
jgi:hypothetical protein